jgi:hypothetical protein
MMTDKRKEIWETLDAGLTKWMSKAYESGRQDERERVVALLQQALDGHKKVLKLRPVGSSADHRHTICRTYQAAIALIKEENK